MQGHPGEIDLLFLDVEMKGMNGMQAAEQIRSFNQEIMLVFATGYSDYVFDGYRVNAMDYILKPVQTERLSDLLERIRKKLVTESDKEYIMKNTEGTYRFMLSEISYFYSDKRKVILVAHDKEYSFYGKLDEVEEQLSNRFVRIHQRYLVNPDLVNHLQTLLAMPEEKRIAYIREMLENKELTQTFHYSGDTTVNVVLSAKQMVMQQKAIHFVPSIEIPEELPFDKTDICALFANALDNAIEACEKLPVEQRRIHMEARQGKGILAVCVSNPCLKVELLQEKTEGKMPRTTKTDAQSHGLGLKSIREVTVKYGGSMEICSGEDAFELFVYLPLED